MENRKHKDSLFIDLFCKDKIEGKENFISLYNALHQSKLDLANTELKEVNIPAQDVVLGKDVFEFCESLEYYKKSKKYIKL